MKNRNPLLDRVSLFIAMFLWLGVDFHALAHDGDTGTGTGDHKIRKPPSCQILMADRVFDGNDLQTHAAVFIKKDKVVQVGAQDQLKKLCKRKVQLGDATILPGFIELHAHLTFQHVDPDTVLRHGITTVRDVGGPLLPPSGGDGRLRLLSSGPLIQAPGGYPINVFGGTSGYDQIGITANSPEEARAVVRNLAKGGATHIKIALEFGGEPGAPWMEPHGSQPPPAWDPDHPWPILDLDTVKAIVDEAHNGVGHPRLTVTAHIGETEGARRALAAGVDEWAHIPCGAIDEVLLEQAVLQGVKFVTTVDTLSSCVENGKGIHSNMHTLARMMEAHPDTGAEFLYGSEIAHDNVPWGINGEEMHLIFHLTSGDTIDFTDVLKVFKAATSRAGIYLGLEPLGTLMPGAAADVIAVRGNPFERFKLMEYPDLVLSGGRTILNTFGK